MLVLNSFWMPLSGSTAANDVDALFDFILFTSIIFFAIVTVAIAFFIFRYRRHDKAGKTYGKDHSMALEITWTAIPVILILIVFVWGFNDYMKMSVVPANAMEVKVTGQRWFWTFDYRDGANTINELVVPIGKPVKLLMSSTDVIHSFFVPAFRVKMDVVPNRYTVTWFEATALGDFPLYCAEYCGKGHSEMLATVRVLPDSSFSTWLETNTVLGEGLTLEEYGEQLYTTKACKTCHGLDQKSVIGPSFRGRFGREIMTTTGERVLVDENYLRESILNPKAKIANGFDPIMPTFQGILKDRQIDALVEFIKKINDQEKE